MFPSYQQLCSDLYGRWKLLQIKPEAKHKDSERERELQLDNYRKSSTQRYALLISPLKQDALWKMWLTCEKMSFWKDWDKRGQHNSPAEEHRRAVREKESSTRDQVLHTDGQREWHFVCCRFSFPQLHTHLFSLLLLTESTVQSVPERSRWTRQFGCDKNRYNFYKKTERE